MPAKKDKPGRLSRSRKKDSKPEAFKSTIVMLTKEDIEWLDELVVHLKRSRRKTSKSEIVRMAIKKFKNMKEDEILEKLRFLE